MEALAQYSGSSSSPSSSSPSSSPSPPRPASQGAQSPPQVLGQCGSREGAEGGAGARGLPQWVLERPVGQPDPGAAARVGRAGRAGASLLVELDRRRAARNPAFAETLAAHLGVELWGSRLPTVAPDPADFFDALAREAEAHAARVRRGEVEAQGVAAPLPAVAFVPAAEADPGRAAAAAAAARISARFAGTEREMEPDRRP